MKTLVKKLILLMMVLLVWFYVIVDGQDLSPLIHAMETVIGTKMS